jgi:hypothetical protein
MFDMKTDPTERNNLAEKEPQRVKMMLAEHNAEQKEPAWPQPGRMEQKHMPGTAFIWLAAALLYNGLFYRR